MTMAAKPEGRRSLEQPYLREMEASVAATARDDRAPRNLSEAIAWFRGVSSDELPMTLHKAGVWRDYGMHAEGGSVLGSPASSELFRRFMENDPSETDENGYYLRPFRAALSRMERRYPLTARHLYRLALVDGDWRRHAANEGMQPEEMQLYLERALFLLWRDFTRQIQRLQ